MRLDKTKLSVALVRKNWDANRLAKNSHLSRTTIYRAMKEGNVKYVTANKICKALDTDIAELIKS